MSRVTPNLGLTVWSDVNDPFNPTQLAANWDAIDAFSVLPRAASSIQNGSALPGAPSTGTIFYLTSAASGFAANTLLEYTGSQWQVIGPRETLAAVPVSGNYVGRTVLLSVANGGFTQWSLIFYDGVTWQKVSGGVELASAIPVTGNFAGRLVLLTASAAPFEAYSLITYNGTSWARTEKRGVEVGTTLPSAPYTGELFYVTTPVSGFQTGDIARWNGSLWQQVSIPQLYTNTAFTTIAGGTPVDGYTAIIQWDAASGTNYTVRYNASSASTYKWEVISGPDLIIAQASTTVLRAGDYNVVGKMWSNENGGTSTGGNEPATLTANGVVIDTTNVNGAAGGSSGVSSRGNVSWTLMGRATGMAAGQGIAMVQTGPGLTSNPVLKYSPIRIA